MNNKKTSTDLNAQDDSNYSGDYLNWKAWNGNTFGKLRRTDSKYFSAEIKKSKVLMPEDSKVLEIGFGNGEFLAYAKERGWIILGTEVNGNLVGIAKEFGYNAIQSDNLSHFNDSDFDLVCAFDVIEHISQDALLDFLREVRRILKPSGIFIARFPNGDSPFGLRSQNGDITHVNAIGSSKARQLAAIVNMEIVSVSGEAQPVLGVAPKHFFYRVISWPFKLIVDLFVNILFLPGAGISFSSQNLTLVLRANKER